MIKHCVSCLKAGRGYVPATDKHHKFSKSKWAIKLYPEYIHHPDNLEDACNGCNGSHASPYLTHWSEIDFCIHFKIEPRSKEGKIIWERMKK